MAVEIIGRGNINVAKTHLDAAFLTKMGLLTKPYEYIFCKAIKRVQSGKAIPKFMMDAVMGKDNNSIIEMLYPNITSNTIKNACEFVYRYNIPENIRSYKGTVLFWRGANWACQSDTAAPCMAFENMQGFHGICIELCYGTVNTTHTQRKSTAMTIKEAYQILGLPPGTSLQEIKKRYRKLMMQMHPDAGIHTKGEYTYNAQEINTAYAALKEILSSGGQTDTPPCNHPKTQTGTIWHAPVNKDAYMERDILQYAEDSIGTIFGNFCIARGKYMWTTDEDFSLFMLSLYQCSKQLLDEADDLLHREDAPANRHRFQAELTYLLAQQFISAAALLKELAKEEKTGTEGDRIFYIPAMLEPSDKTVSLQPGETLYPSRMNQHRLFLKNGAGQESGYLSFTDDRLYYIVIPLFEQKSARVKIQAASRQPKKKNRTATHYQNLHVWLKLSGRDCNKMPENLNLQIEQLLRQYTAHD